VTASLVVSDPPQVTIARGRVSCGIGPSIGGE
jgi:hypothetical protein